jgi:hypothetical protein
MTHVNRPAPHSTIANENRARRAVPSSARSRRIQLVSEGVVASYIHDLAQHHGTPGPFGARTAARRV